MGDTAYPKDMFRKMMIEDDWFNLHVFIISANTTT